MRNRADKYAVRWFHFTHQFIAGHQFIAVNPKLLCWVAEVFQYFVSNIFKKNNSTLIKSGET